MRASHPNLFAAADEPLAARMRPRTLQEFVGQAHILGPGRLLRRAILADRLGSIILHGPPGTGKTTLAQVIANSTQAEFHALNAVLSGVKDLREAVAAARERQRRGQRTLLFVDEVHRFNKAQQDALLPSVEAGVVTFIGATTQNPFFEVNAALVSRSRVFQLLPLSEEDLLQVARAALADNERGLGARKVRIDDAALAHLANVANGDARTLLNALELAVVTTEAEEDGSVRIDREAAEASIQRRAVLYDKEGDAHYDIVSAFIKSVRGSDPDAALYWLARMVEAGEDPAFLWRRLRILAAEDVGLADPQALAQVEAAAQAFEAVGLPEGRWQLAFATLRLANAPKSNSAMAFFDALAAVRSERNESVPNHLKDPNRDAEGFGHGAGYLYPHAYREHWVAQSYLPPALQGRLFYHPSDQGEEAAVQERVSRRREAQLAAMLDQDAHAPPEALAWGPGDAALDRWAARTLSGRGARLERLREALFELVAAARHHRILDLSSGSGWTVFEALRRAPAGETWALLRDSRAAETIQGQVRARPELERPLVRVAPAGAVAEVVRQLARERDEADVDPRFDRIVAVRYLSESDGDQDLASLAGLLAADGTAVFADPLASEAPRLHALVDLQGVSEAVREAVIAAEEAAYAEADEPRFRFRPDRAEERMRAAGFQLRRTRNLEFPEQRRFPDKALSAWFAPGAPFRQRLSELGVKDREIALVQDRFRTSLQEREVAWYSRWSLLEATPAAGGSGPRRPPGADA